jgi:hypothetical protein
MNWYRKAQVENNGMSREDVEKERAYERRALALQIGQAITEDVRTLNESVGMLQDEDAKRFLQVVLKDFYARLRSFGVPV